MHYADKLHCLGNPPPLNGLWKKSRISKLVTWLQKRRGRKETWGYFRFCLDVSHEPNTIHFVLLWKIVQAGFQPHWICLHCQHGSCRTVNFLSPLAKLFQLFGLKMLRSQCNFSGVPISLSEANLGFSNIPRQDDCCNNVQHTAYFK